MIAQLSGTVAARDASTLLIDVQGVGYSVTCTPRALMRAVPGTTIVLPTALIVREDAWLLFGFADTTERDTFTLLQSVSGIGPRIALAAVSTLESDRIAIAIAGSDIALLTKIPGIGRKGAERMCVELRDRMHAMAPVAAGWQVAVREALVGLGWNAQLADSAVAQVAIDLEDPEVPDALRAALQILGRR